MKMYLKRNLPILLLTLVVTAFFSACELNDSSSHDFGENDPGTILCIGDSVTYGYGVGAGQSYPAQLSAMEGRRTINAGKRGEQSGQGRIRFERLLDQHKPGYALILYGANDVSHGSSASTPDHLRQMIQAAKARQTVPVVATVPPTSRGHAHMQTEIDNLNPRIRQMAGEENAHLADLERAFAGNTAGLLLADGLHPNAEGLRVIAAAFSKQID